MAKYKSGNFFQVSRYPFQSDACRPRINDLSLSAFKLYFWLHELEHRFTTGLEDTKKKKRVGWFYHSDEQLAHDTGMSKRSISSAKKQLKDQGFIETFQMHWIDPGTNKKSHKHVTAFRITDQQNANFTF